MFAVAAQTTVRATAQVKATKVAAKQQKSAYVHPRFPAFLISRRSSSPAIAGKSAREARRRRRRARGDRTRARRLSTRHETARAARRDGRPRLQASSPSSSVARTTTSFVTPQKTVARDTHQTFSKNAPPAVPSPPRLPAPPPRCSCSRPPRRSRTASRCRTAPTRRPASTSSPSTTPARWLRWRRTPPPSSPRRGRASPPTSRRVRRIARPSPARPASPPWMSTTSKRRALRHYRHRRKSRDCAREDDRGARVGTRYVPVAPAGGGLRARRGTTLSSSE